MDIPAESLEQFKCSKCENHLRRAPVHLQPDGLALCPACFKPPCVATRDKYYEAAARLLRFPCRNVDLGCKENVPFLEEGCILSEHEEVCPYRQYVCPLLGSSSCEWLGTRDQIAQHCNTAHRHLVLQNPATLTHDFATSSQRTFLLTAFNALFLLYVKVCTSSTQIYHSIRYLGTTSEVSQCKYILQIKRENVKIEREDSVAPQGCLVIQEPTSLALDINSLLSVMGGGAGTTFTIILQRTSTELRENIPKSKTEENRKSYRTSKNRNFDGFALNKAICTKNGCNYLDYPVKLQKHDRYFCTLSTVCMICNQKVDVDLLVHYRLVHKNIIFRGDSKLRVHPGKDVQCCLLSCIFGLAFCSYTWNESKFALYVFLSISRERLQQLSCEVNIMDSIFFKNKTYTPDLLLHSVHDWEIDTDFISYFGTQASLDVNIKFYEKS